MSTKGWKPLTPPKSMFVAGAAAYLTRSLGEEDKVWVRNGLTVTLAVVMVCLLTLRNQIETSQERGTVLAEKEDKETKQKKMESIPIVEYDKGELSSLQTRLMVGCLFSYGVYAAFGFIQPLVVQLSVQLFHIAIHPLVRIYFFGAKAKGSLSRPFSTKNDKDVFKEDLKEHTGRISDAFNYWAKGEKPYAGAKPVGGKERRAQKRLAKGGQN